MPAVSGPSDQFRNGHLRFAQVCHLLTDNEMYSGMMYPNSSLPSRNPVVLGAHALFKNGLSGAFSVFERLLDPDRQSVPHSHPVGMVAIEPTNGQLGSNSPGTDNIRWPHIQQFPILIRHVVVVEVDVRIVVECLRIKHAHQKHGLKSIVVDWKIQFSGTQGQLGIGLHRCSRQGFQVVAMV